MESLALAIALVVGVIPLDLVASEHVDTVERNWVTSPDGTQLRFCQLLFVDIDLKTGERRIRAWRMMNCIHGEYEGIKCALVTGPVLGKRMIWDDKGTIRDLTVGYVEETVTPCDPEELQRATWRSEWRRDILPSMAERSRVRGR